MVGVLEIFTIPRASGYPAVSLSPIVSTPVSRLSGHRNIINLLVSRGLRIQSFDSSGSVSLRSKSGRRVARIVCEAQEAVQGHMCTNLITTIAFLSLFQPRKKRFFLVAPPLLVTKRISISICQWNPRGTCDVVLVDIQTLIRDFDEINGTVKLMKYSKSKGSAAGLPYPMKDVDSLMSYPPFSFSNYMSLLVSAKAKARSTGNPNYRLMSTAASETSSSKWRVRGCWKNTRCPLIGANACDWISFAPMQPMVVAELMEPMEKEFKFR
ncbi:hypothetical protein L2E82_22312 [Cichorium intybus]|uniref:Uncharacterized protein n=1 Tax=Cichorium intybus TaxID=13427 RepID=A0ACB9DXA0_CICIN|nr:hypothetical protein L2E82_22312 [Cichorium intybus]